MKTALVYDRVNKWGGAERVLLALHRLFPEAPLYTSVYDSQGAPWAKDFKVIPSFLQNFPFAKKNHEAYPFLMPLAFESFDFGEFDLVISVTSEAAKGIITQPKTVHLCYCLTPTRYLWSGYEEYFRNNLQRLAFGWLVNCLRKWDLIAAQRPDKYLAISKTVQKRIKKYYGRDSSVVYPPVDLSKFDLQEPGQKNKINEEYFLVVSRLVKYKKIDLAIKAFNQLGKNLKIVGLGSQMVKLKRMAQKNIQFLGQLTDQDLVRYYQNCQAVIFPQEEDFGLVPIEAQACGKPVIAFRAGGATETVVEGKTGELFYPQSADALIKVLKSFKARKYRPEVCRKQAENFSLEGFLKTFSSQIADLLDKR